jgi:hypothetical protein
MSPTPSGVREHRVVDLLPAELAVGVEHHLGDGAVHHRAREQRRRDEHLVGHGLAIRTGQGPDECADAEPHGDEVEERLEEARGDHQPLPAIEVDAALEEVARPPRAQGAGRNDPAEGEG